LPKRFSVQRKMAVVEIMRARALFMGAIVVAWRNRSSKPSATNSSRRKAKAPRPHRYRSEITRHPQRDCSGHKAMAQSNRLTKKTVAHAEKMPGLQEAVPSHSQRAWQRRANPLLMNPLRLAPEST
jgi:Mg-chelatase subunit ChlI